MARDSTGPVPLSGTEPFTADERLALRRLLRDQDRVRWVARLFKVLIPIGIASGTALWGLIEWARNHVNLR